MTIQDNIKLDEEFIAGWNARDTDRTVAVLADDAVWQDISNPEPMRDKSAMRQYVQAWYTAFPDLSAVVKNRVVTEDQVATEVEFTGTNTGSLQMAPGVPAIPATGKKVQGKGVYFAKVQNGKIVEIHTYPDMAGMMMQLGLFK